MAAVHWAKDCAARVWAARQVNPHLIFLAATFSVDEALSFEEQARFLRRVLQHLRRRTKGCWEKVLGVIWILEPARSKSGKWRAHYHCVLAIDECDQPRHQRQFAVEFAKAARRIGWPDEPWDPMQDKDRVYHRLRKRQRVEPLDAFGGNRMTAQLSAEASLEAIVETSSMPSSTGGSRAAFASTTIAAIFSPRT